MGEKKKTFVKHEHYIPQFVLKNFQNEERKILFTNIGLFPLKVNKGSSEKVMQERDFYEIKDNSGYYVLRNSLEDDYSSLEGKIKPNFAEFIDLIRKDDFQDKFIQIIKNNRWADIEANLLLYLVITLNRGKKVKNLVYSKSNLGDREKNILYMLLTTSPAKVAEYAKGLYTGQDLEDVLQFIMTSSKNALSTLSEHIMNNFQIRVHKVSNSKRFFLSDNPVIVQKFEGEDYLFPISPQICLGLVPIRMNGDKISIDSYIYPITDDDVERINKQSVLNTDRLIIISSDNDIDFISNILSEKI